MRRVRLASVRSWNPVDPPCRAGLARLTARIARSAQKFASLHAIVTDVWRPVTIGGSSPAHPARAYRPEKRFISDRKMFTIDTKMPVARITA